MPGATEPEKQLALEYFARGRFDRDTALTRFHDAHRMASGMRIGFHRPSEASRAGRPATVWNSA